MKTKKDLKKSVSLKMFLILSLIAVALIAFSSCGKDKTTDVTGTEIAPPPPPPPPDAIDEKVDEAYQEVDEMPLFLGGDTALLGYLARNTVYPKESREKGTTGRILIRFMVKKDGTVSSVTVIKGVDPLLDAESVRVVSTLPKFTPGKLKGIAVPVWYMVPITFALN